MGNHHSHNHHHHNNNNSSVSSTTTTLNSPKSSPKSNKNNVNNNGSSTTGTGTTTSTNLDTINKGNNNNNTNNIINNNNNYNCSSISSSSGKENNNAIITQVVEEIQEEDLEFSKDIYQAIHLQEDLDNNNQKENVIDTILLAGISNMGKTTLWNEWKETFSNQELLEIRQAAMMYCLQNLQNLFNYLKLNFYETDHEVSNLEIKYKIFLQNKIERKHLNISFLQKLLEFWRENKIQEIAKQKPDLLDGEFLDYFLNEKLVEFVNLGNLNLCILQKEDILKVKFTTNLLNPLKFNYKKRSINTKVLQLIEKRKRELQNLKKLNLNNVNYVNNNNNGAISPKTVAKLNLSSTSPVPKLQMNALQRSTENSGQNNTTNNGTTLPEHLHQLIPKSPRIYLRSSSVIVNNRDTSLSPKSPRGFIEKLTPRLRSTSSATGNNNGNNNNNSGGGIIGGLFTSSNESPRDDIMNNMNSGGNNNNNNGNGNGGNNSGNGSSSGMPRNGSKGSFQDLTNMVKLNKSNSAERLSTSSPRNTNNNIVIANNNLTNNENNLEQVMVKKLDEFEKRKLRKYTILDSPGQLDQRMLVQMSVSKVRTLIFVFAISDFDLSINNNLNNEKLKTKLDDALEYFKSFNSFKFRKILLFTKIDKLMKRCKQGEFIDFDNSPMKIFNFVKNSFTKVNNNNTLEIHAVNVLNEREMDELNYHLFMLSSSEMSVMSPVLTGIDFMQWKLFSICKYKQFTDCDILF